MANGQSAAERNRLYLQNLQRKKTLEKEAEAARNKSRAGELEKERGFLNCFNGANRDLASRPGPPATAKPQHRDAPLRGNNGERCLRVPGALPVRAPFAHREAWPDDDQEAPQPMTAAAPPLRTAQTGRERPVERRIRRQWQLGKAVLLRGEDGEMLQVDPHPEQWPDPEWTQAAAAAPTLAVS